MQGPPPELLGEILEAFAVPLGFQTDSLPDRATLLSCSLVCKSWAMESQRLLFRRALISDRGRGFRWAGPDAAFSFRLVITTSTPKSRWLRETVVSIVLRPDPTTRSGETFTILMNLPNLREVDLKGAECMFSENELFQLRTTGPRICSLRVHPDAYGPRRTLARVIWPAIVRLIAALPTLRMLDITTLDSFGGFPPMQELIPPLGLSLLAFELRSKWAKDVGSFLSSLNGGRTDDEPLELYTHTGYSMFPDLRDVLFAHGPHLRSLLVKGSIKDVSVLGLCTRLQRFECQCLPSDALVAAIPRTIRALAVTNPTTQESNVTSLAYLTQQLDTFLAMEVFTWVGSTAHSEFAALRHRCTQLGRELRTREIDSLSDDDVQFALRNRLLRI
ncbi:hypothetical protein C8R45DRAFT_1212947 [Mycena sanguinolenta]|nr:hypothetical protein C8R45DRAFT_1212947 [Mycena sanguinolenta]